MAPELLFATRMRLPRQVRLTDHLSENRILVRVPPIPRVKILLALAQTLTRDGSVRDALPFYQELANLSSPWIAGERNQQHPRLKVYQVSSNGVQKLTAAMAFSPAGVKLDEGETAHLFLLLATPADSIAPYLALLAHVVCLLQPQPRRDLLLGCQDAGQALSQLTRMEDEPVAANSP